MYDEQVKRLRSEAVYLPEKFSKNAELLDVLMKAADAIEELQKQRDEWESHAALAESFAQGWIPVTERLPENAGVYLCRIKSFNGDFRYTDTMKYVDGLFYEQGVATDRVTHWMPLPQPPKEE